jgi:hypothetical protein
MPRRKRPPHPAGPVHDFADRLYPTLDLHGQTAAEARRRADRWLADRQREDARTVRLVTGWGRHSVGPPVLRAEIEDLLRALRGERVASFTLESGSGAFRVELSRPSPDVPRGAPPPPSLPPPTSELRRAAEESLAELHVTPTPELLRAEIERLRDARNAKDD